MRCTYSSKVPKCAEDAPVPLAVASLYRPEIGLTSLDLDDHTPGMKTAVSIPDDVLEEAERLVAELQTSRSQLYSRALKEFVTRHAPDRLMEVMNCVVDEVGNGVDEFSQRAARRVLEQVDW